MSTSANTPSPIQSGERQPEDLQAELAVARSENARLLRQNKKYEEALHRAQSRLDTLFQEAHDAVFIATPEDRILAANAKAEELFQAGREELLRLRLRADLYRPRSPLAKFQELWSRLEAGETASFQWVAIRPGGQGLFPVETFLKKITWDDQSALLVTIRDITRRRQAKNVLRQRRKQLSLILDGNPIATFVIDTNHKVILWNTACEKLTGVSKAQCLGRPVDSGIFYSGTSRPVLADLVLEMDQERILSWYNDKNLTESSFIPESYEATDQLVIRGVSRDIFFLAARCRGEDGEVIGAIETLQDVTKRTQAEKALLASKKLLMEITANIPGVVYQYQAAGPRKGHFTFISDGVRAMLQLCPEEVIRDPDQFFTRVGDEARDRFQRSLRADALAGQLVEFEFSLEGDPSGKKWLKNCSLAAVTTDGGVEWNSVLTDISEIKRMELMRADVERMVRHDLKSPLTGIGGLAKILLKKDLGQVERECATTIYQSAMKLLHMINHSLDLFKMEEQTYTLRPEDVDLTALLHTLHDEFAPSARAREQSLVYLLDGKPLDWNQPHIIRGEQVLLESLFANLIQNALDAAPEKTRITIALRSGPNAYVVDIHNRGAIPEKIRNTFFQRYVTCGKQHGTGIGTYSAMLITRAHHGKIRFTTSEEDGTHLIVTLPVE
jgi:PAS domain S-box-containing protein